jgi:hypothetical protein
MIAIAALALAAQVGVSCGNGRDVPLLEHGLQNAEKPSDDMWSAPAAERRACPCTGAEVCADQVCEPADLWTVEVRAHEEPGGSGHLRATGQSRTEETAGCRSVVLPQAIAEFAKTPPRSPLGPHSVSSVRVDLGDREPVELELPSPETGSWTSGHRLSDIGNGSAKASFFGEEGIITELGPISTPAAPQIDAPTWVRGMDYTLTWEPAV